MTAEKKMSADPNLFRDLPDEDGARRFFNQLSEMNPAQTRKLEKNPSLLSDVLAIAAYSPLLATTLQQNPQYFAWLERRRENDAVCSKEELLESLARFSLTNSQIEPQVLLSRFRRRELLRIYLRDIRRLETIAETTEEISNLADAILEYALGIAKQELDNRFGIPLEADEKERAKPAQFCVVSLGKLGSRELNYSSDIDLLFLYSNDGTTSGKGKRGAVTNREYFIKLAELVTKIVGQQTGEGAAYRVDLRLRPYGRVGALAVSLKEAVEYYQNQAQPWERQTMIRSRAGAGDERIFKNFWKKIESKVYSKTETVENALQNVKLSKDKINLEHAVNNGYNVKLGKGGIREIEFIAQALQLAYGGRDRWLRSPHTLISLSRLADRNLLSESELTKLSVAYEFLRRLEHRLQMEHGLQTHLVPVDADKKNLVAGRMGFKNLKSFDAALLKHTANVSQIFERIFSTAKSSSEPAETDFQMLVSDSKTFDSPDENPALSQVLASVGKSSFGTSVNKTSLDSLTEFSKISPHFAELISASPQLLNSLPAKSAEFKNKNYEEALAAAIAGKPSFGEILAALRIEWTKCFLEIAAFDVFNKIDLAQSKKLQTELAEAAIKTALKITESEIGRKSELQVANCELRLAVLGLGKLGGRGMDYGSDLDLVLVYDDETAVPKNQTHAEFYSRAVDIFVSVLSSFTREGNLYRVDLRLRPDGKNGAAAIGKNAFFNYLETRSAIWEWLAYVKLRGVSGNTNLAAESEKRARQIVHQNALKTTEGELKNETRRVRERLAQAKTVGKTTDIKFGGGGLLDVYFAVRFLQLRDGVYDDEENRSTQYMLKKLYENKSLSAENYSALSAGHKFLSCLDHNLRLTVGRSNRLPSADKAILQIVATRMQIDSVQNLLEKLALHRMEIRAAFDNALS